MSTSHFISGVIALVAIANATHAAELQVQFQPSEPVTIKGGQGFGCEARCDTRNGYIVTGGGFEFQGNPNVNIIRSEPGTVTRGNYNGWFVGGFSNERPGTEGQMRCYAMCARVH